MPTHRATAIDVSASVPLRRRRWPALVVVLLVLGGYAGALAWVTVQVEAGVVHSLQPLPALQESALQPSAPPYEQP